MSDSGIGSKVTGAVSSVENTVFFKFAKPYLDFIGKGTMFTIVYIIGAGASILMPIIAIVAAAVSGIFTAGAQAVIWFIFTWFFIAFAGWIGFQLWWDRKSQVTEVRDSEFVATPIIADIVRTFGEWLGTFMAIVGFGAGLFGLIIYFDLLSELPGGPALIIVGPIAGFFTILFFRLAAESLKIFVNIANSVRDIAKK
ncbi:MAG: hypothetical protein FWD13_07760 [Treponema sp.]|nr:hypothetical protein [Treponema sp.]